MVGSGGPWNVSKKNQVGEYALNVGYLLNSVLWKNGHMQLHKPLRSERRSGALRGKSGKGDG